MSIYGSLQKGERRVKDIIRTAYYNIFETKEVIRKSSLYKDVIWSKEEQKEFDDYWETLLGKKISNRWHKLYQSYNGYFCKEYIPEILYTTYIEPRLNDSLYARVFGNKGLTDIILKSEDVILPYNFCFSDGKFYYDHDHNVISCDAFWNIVGNAGQILIKPASCFGSGEGILFLNMINGVDQYTGKNISEVKRSMISTEIIVQEYFEQHSDVAAICSKSMNTIRISTYIVNGEVHYSPIAMRCGSGESKLDNIHVGGLCIGLNDDGVAEDVAYKLGYSDICERYTEHPYSKISFGKLKIPYINRVVNAACMLHGRTPHIGVIGWDFSIAKDGTPVIIEQNFHGNGIWFPQIVDKKCFFRDDSFEIFRAVGLKK